MEQQKPINNTTDDQWSNQVNSAEPRVDTASAQWRPVVKYKIKNATTASQIIEKPKRIRLTDRQHELLEKTFAKMKHPTRQLKHSLAAELSIPLHSIQVWFQNRRQREKRKSKEAGRAPEKRSTRSPEMMTNSTTTCKTHQATTDTSSASHTLESNDASSQSLSCSHASAASPSPELPCLGALSMHWSQSTSEAFRAYLTSPCRADNNNNNHSNLFVALPFECGSKGNTNHPDDSGMLFNLSGMVAEGISAAMAECSPRFIQI
eukprot:GEZU01020417.1.p1 GENE.GEZU01020417.1~~GEZU01020417.1.p1  ORF type:complete len:263 (+),score=30.86 GEZU01020417.1:264-1052(+)